MKPINLHLFKSLVDLTADAVFILRVQAGGQEFIMEYVNGAYLHKFNLVREQVIGKELAAFLPPDRLNLVRTRFSNCVSNRISLSYEEIIQIGDEVNTSLSEIFPIFSGDGSIEYVVGISKDITEWKKQEMQIQKHVKALQEIAKIQSHEIRRPVANIIGLAELIDLKDKSAGENKAAIRFLRASAAELDELIKRIVIKTHDSHE